MAQVVVGNGILVCASVSGCHLRVQHLFPPLISSIMLAHCLLLELFGPKHHLHTIEHDETLDKHG